MNKNPTIPLLLASLFAGAISCPLAAAEFSARIVDGLGRPLPDVAVEIRCPKKGRDNTAQETQRGFDAD